MRSIKNSQRIKKIENRRNDSISDLLHHMHWDNDMMHREIGDKLGVPRPTITRWLKLFGVPTQTHHRFTDKNLASWLYKTGKLKRKIRVKGPDRRIQGTKQNVNVDFFKRWSPEMAYVLGFFSADGGMFINSGGSKYIQFTSTDKEILIKIKRLMDANHKIGIKKKNSSNLGWKECYLIQIGSKEMYNDLLKLGFTPKKDLTLKFPKIPNKYLGHFIRGYFDGDGSVSFGTYKRKSRNNKVTFYILTSFISGSKNFLSKLSKELHLIANINKGYLGRKSNNSGYQLSYSINDSKKLFRYMYGDISSIIDYYLERKYNKFVKAISFQN